MAEGVDGTVGYVLHKDLNDDYGVKNPEQALKYQKEHAGKSRVIPLYASDGKTIIGKFRIDSGTVTLKN
ncbi:MAG TPA: hypothetical protein DC024_06015 [Clostridiales bacterium]|nr:hypothetical protein [Clostridiales bacterium]